MTFVSHAQNFEDVRLWRAFSDILEGRYLDIGTQDPVRDSVSLAFYERGWRGVHVEPTPSYAAAMRLARPDETVIEAAVSNAPGPIQFFEIPETGLSTGVGEIADRHAKAGWEHRMIAVPTVTLAGLFDLMGDAPIHWLKIDVEGMEADVIKSWGDHPARPIALVIEATAPSTQTLSHAAWYDLVLSRGYRDVLFDGLSRYFIHETHAERGAALALSPNVFDGFNVDSTHFVAGRLVGEGESAIVAARRNAEIERLDALAATRAMAEAEREEAVAAATAKAEAERLAEIAALSQQAEAERQEALAAALAQAEAKHLDEVAALRQQAESERTRVLADALAQAEAERLAEIAALGQQAEAGRQEALAAALAQAEAKHLDEVAALRQQAESERTRVLADALAQAEAERLAEIAALGQQAEAGRQEALAAALAQAEAKHLDEIAALRQQAESERTGALAAARAEAAAVLEAIRTELDARIAAGEEVLAGMRQTLAAQQQQGQTSAREAGRLEGQLAAQIEASAARMRDAEAVRRDLAMRLSRSEKALEAARANGADLREKVQALIGEHALALMGANVSLEATEARAAQLTEQFAGIKRRLAESEAGRELAQRQRDEALRESAAQVASHTAELERLHGHIATANQHLAESEAGRELAQRQRDEALRESAAQAASHAAELDRLHGHIAWREMQLAQVMRLLDLEPDPLAGWPRRVATLLARAVGRRPESIAADHAAQMLAWRADVALPRAVGLEGTEFSLAEDRPMPDLDRVWKDLEMSGGEGPVTSMPRLLAPHDAEFIRIAYEALLGRAPDPEGGAYYLGRLRAGVHKLEILKQLRRSPEGREFIPGVAGLDRAIKRHRWATLPVIGLIVRRLTWAEGNGATHRQLRILANDIGRLGTEQAAVMRAVQELVARAVARPDHAFLPRPVDPRPETETLDGFGVTARDEEPSDPGLGKGASHILRLLASSMRTRQTQGAG